MSHFKKETVNRRTTSAWLIDEYSVLGNRLQLIDRYNAVAGPPSAAVKHVQGEFVNNHMVREEMVAFVLVCEGLITASERRHVRLPKNFD